MTAEAPNRPPIGVAPSVAMDGPVLPRRGLSVGAIGHGSEGRRYRLLAPMQRGGMGELFLTRVSQPGRPDRQVVIKRLLADLVDDPKYVEMFKSEAWVMQALEHENIVRVYDTPIIDRAQCLAMELVRGKSAQQILARCEEKGARVPPTVALGVMAKILRALEYAHGFRLDDGAPLNLVHRDVSPGNVLVSYEGDVKLTDFGIAKSQMSVVSTTVGIVKGKARYLAPEQILGEPASPRSDIFSAATVTCELLTGEPTFDCTSVPKTLYAIVNGERKDLAEQLPFRAPMLVQLIDRALATDPSARVQTAAELAAGFEAQIRVLGPQLGDPAIGPWLEALFADERDEALELDVAEPIVRPAHEESATEHAYRPAPPLLDPAEPADHGPATVQERALAPATDLIERPAVTTTALSEGTGPILTDRGPSPALRATIAGGAPEPAPDPAEPPRSGPGDRAAPRTRTVVEAELVDPSPSVEGFAEPTQIVRQRTTRSVEDSASVNEALSVLAFLQAQKAPAGSEPAPAPTAPRLPKLPVGEPVGEIPPLRPQRGPKALLFSVGVAVGIAATLGAQALLPNAPPPTPLAASATAPLSAALVEPPEPAAEPRPLEPAPAPEAEVEVAPPPPAPPATLDVTYPRGARVWLDGAWLTNRVPIVGIELPPGPHELRVRKRRYRRRVRFEAEPGAHFEMRRKLSGP